MLATDRWQRMGDRGRQESLGGGTDSFAIYRNEPGLPASGGQALFEDPRGRIWLSNYGGTRHISSATALSQSSGSPDNDIISITGDERNLWLSGPGDLGAVPGRPARRRNPTGPRSAPKNRAIGVADRGGVWLGHSEDGGVQFFKDGKVRETYTPADGLGTGHVAHLRLDRDGAVWAATRTGLSRIKDGRVRTLTIATICRALQSTGRSKTTTGPCG